MVQVLSGRQAANKVVAVAPVVTGALDLGQVGHLVQHTSSLVLGVAGAAQRRQIGEEERTVDHLASRGVGVRQHAAGAGAQDIGAVISGVTAGTGAALGGDPVEHGCNGALCRGRGRLEVLVHFGVVRLGIGRSRACEQGTIGECGGYYGAAGTRAVRLDDCALCELLVVAADLTSLLAVDSCVQTVTDEGNCTDDVGGVKVSVSESTLSENLEGTARAQIVCNSYVKGRLNALASSKDLKSRLFEVLCADAETKTIEGNFLLSLEDLNLLNVGVIKESAGLEELEIFGSGVFDQGPDCGVTGELEFDIKRRVVKREAGSQSSQSGERKSLNLHDICLKRVW